MGYEFINGTKVACEIGNYCEQEENYPVSNDFINPQYTALSYRSVTA